MGIILPCAHHFVRKSAYDVTAAKQFLRHEDFVLLHTSHHLSQRMNLSYHILAVPATENCSQSTAFHDYNPIFRYFRKT